MKKEKRQNEPGTKKEEFYEHKPNREFKATLSKDGKYWIFKDITTHIVSREYLETVEKCCRDESSNGGRGVQTMGAGNAKSD